MTKIQGAASKRQYRQYDENVVSSVVAAIKRKEISINKAAKQFKIAKGTLVNRVNNAHTKSVGSPLVLTTTEEETLIEHIITVSEWGFPFDKNDLCQLTKLYLDKSQRKVRRFKDNLPTRQWAGRFLKRHRKELSNKKCQNIKRSKAEIKAETMQRYFDNLKETLTEEDGTLVPPHRIFNYDETNLSDDPGTKRCIFKRGVKYPERIMDSSKASTSLMFCGSAAGDVLPPYVVYKSKHLYSEWVKGGPVGTRYNCSKSGWFDATVFQDWFEQTFVAHVKENKLQEQGKVVVIGDNLSSHFSPEVLTLCEENNISFVCLPKNSTHLAQPLDVSFYGPLKKYWRGILDKWKKGLQKKSQTITKQKFPSLLNQVYGKICGCESQSAQLVSGFKKTGIVPFNPDEIICRLPSITEVDTPKLVSESVIEMLKDLRSGESSDKKQRQTKLNVHPGKSVGLADLPQLLTPLNKNKKTESMRTKLRKMVKVSKTKKGKTMKKPVKVTKKRRAAKKTEKKGKKAAVVSDSEGSDVTAITKKKPGHKKRRVRNVISDSENESMEPVLKAVERKVMRKPRAPSNFSKSKQFASKKKSVGGGKKQNKRKNVTADCNSDSEEVSEKSFKDTIRPSISEIAVGDYVLIEYELGACKIHYIGLVKSISRDVLGVNYLVKTGTNFILPELVDDNIILPTQVVKVLHPPKTVRHKLIFQNIDCGFNFM